MMPCSIEEVQFNTVIIDLIPLFHQLTALPTRSPLVKVMDILIGLIRKIYAPHKMKRIDVISDNYVNDVAVIKKANEVLVALQTN